VLSCARDAAPGPRHDYGMACSVGDQFFRGESWRAGERASYRGALGFGLGFEASHLVGRCQDPVDEVRRARCDGEGCPLDEQIVHARKRACGGGSELHWDERVADGIRMGFTGHDFFVFEFWSYRS